MNLSRLRPAWGMGTGLCKAQEELQPKLQPCDLQNSSTSLLSSDTPPQSAGKEFPSSVGAGAAGAAMGAPPTEGPETLKSLSI